MQLNFLITEPCCTSAFRYWLFSIIPSFFIPSVFCFLARGVQASTMHGRGHTPPFLWSTPSGHIWNMKLQTSLLLNASLDRSGLSCVKLMSVCHARLHPETATERRRELSKLSQWFPARDTSSQRNCFSIPTSAKHSIRQWWCLGMRPAVVELSSVIIVE